MNFNVLISTSVLLVFISCSKDKIDKELNMKEEVVINFANIAEANYSDALQDAKDLQSVILRFTSNPTTTTHELAKYAWLNSRESYGQTETFRFMNGPIDNQNGPEGNLNAWPLDEAYIDYVYDSSTHSYVNNGLISDSSFVISSENLRDANEKGGETNISIGYHAIEFLLWGQDLNYDSNTHTTSYSYSGQRTYKDFSEKPLAERRKKYLIATTELLVEDLKYLVDAWSKNGWGRTAFTTKDTDKAIADIMTGMAMLSKGELAGERMFVAIDNKDQEDEHSCFSDNTHRDIYTNALGIKNVYFGNYKDIIGSSIKDLLENTDTQFEALLTEHFNETWKTIENVDKNAPFDKQLLNENVTGNGPIMTAVSALQKQGDLIVQAGKKMSLTVTADLEE